MFIIDGHTLPLDLPFEHDGNPVSCQLAAFSNARGDGQQ